MAEGLPILSEARDRLDAASDLLDVQRRLMLLVMDVLETRVRQELESGLDDPGYASLHLSVLAEDGCVMLEWIHKEVRACFCVECDVGESSWHVVWRIPWRGDMDSVYGDLSEANVFEVVDEAVRRVTEVLRNKKAVVAV